MRSSPFAQLLSASRGRRTAPQQSHAPRFSPRGALRSRHFFHGLLESPRSLRVLLLLLAAVPLLGAAYPGGQAPAPPPDPVESGAWLKIFGIISGAPDPVVLSEAEVNALLGSAQLTAIFTERAGLTGVQARLLPDEVHLRGRIEVSRLASGARSARPATRKSAPAHRTRTAVAGHRGCGGSHRASGNHLRDGAAAPGHRRSGVGSAFRGLDGPVSGREPTQSGRDSLSAAAEN